MIHGRCSMPTALVTGQPTDAEIEQEILRDPKVRKALAAPDDPEDREDLIDGLIALRRADRGIDEAIPWEEALKRLGWS
jgi:hypothetical protein